MAGNIFFQGAVFAMNSGTDPTVFRIVERAVDVQFNAQPPRANTMVLGRVSPLNDRPVINYTPTQLNAGYVMGSKDVPRMFGLLNSTGVAVQIGQGTTISDYGARSFQVYNAPTSSRSYAGQYDITTGVLKTFSISTSVGSPAQITFSVEAFDQQQSANNNARGIPEYSGQLVKPQNVTFTGIDFAGLGFSGLIVQSVNFGLTFNHAQTFRLGDMFPERRMTEANATLQVSAFLENVNNSVPTFTRYNCGNYITGTYTMTLQPSCVTTSQEAPLVITFVNPYLESLSYGASVGNFVGISIAYSLPLSFVPFEATGLNASNVIMT